MPARKCESCGSTDIESDPVRADAVCTKCGTVCESGLIVSDVQVVQYPQYQCCESFLFSVLCGV